MEQQQQISIDIKSLSTKARRRMRTSKEETAILENYYRQNPNPNNEQKQKIAKEVEMGARNVHFWFQNRRAKDNKRKKLLQQKQKEYDRQQKEQQEIIIREQQQGFNNDNIAVTALGSHQQSLKQKGKLKLPPISSIMVPSLEDLSISFYFHHAKFGIEDCMLQWSQFHNNASDENQHF
ncbi:MAG: hypothetical protein EXX96DRAFT_650946 [Benjaminiella poitrasii]|nr:MAG: hypothetical protein EXX96DRAFT_650946 [Benjaminiella poitrasii]